jgi:hypothetical protein
MPTSQEARFEPSADLRTRVSGFRVARISPGPTYKLVHLPGGEASMMFRATGAGSGDLSAVGPLRRARYKTVGNAQFYVRVGLHPGRARRVLGLPLYELADRIVPLEAAWNSLGRSLCAQLIESEPALVVPLIEEALRKFMRLRKTEPSVVNQIVGSGLLWLFRPLTNKNSGFAPPGSGGAKIRRRGPSPDQKSSFSGRSFFRSSIAWLRFVSGQPLNSKYSVILISRGNHSFSSAGAIIRANSLM